MSRTLSPVLNVCILFVQSMKSGHLRIVSQWWFHSLPLSLSLSHRRIWTLSLISIWILTRRICGRGSGPFGASSLKLPLPFHLRAKVSLSRYSTAFSPVLHVFQLYIYLHLIQVHCIYTSMFESWFSKCNLLARPPETYTWTCFLEYTSTHPTCWALGHIRTCIYTVHCTYNVYTLYVLRHILSFIYIYTNMVRQL